MRTRRHYTADITRTFPASGRYTPQQRDVYDAVLDAQVRHALATCACQVCHATVSAACARLPRVRHVCAIIACLPVSS